MIALSYDDGKTWHRANGVCNAGGWWGETWVVAIDWGFDTGMFVVESDNEANALDEFIDSKWAHLILMDEGDYDPETWEAFGGNDGLAYNPDSVRFIQRCKVNYFAKRNTVKGYE